MLHKVKYGFLAAFLVWGCQFAFAQAAQHAVGSNVITPEGTVYTITIENNQTVRRPYTSSGAFLSYSFNTWETITGSSAEDLALPVGSFIPPQDGKIICSDRGSDKGTCYLITGSKKAGFTSASVFKGLGYSFNNVMSGDVSFLPSTANIDTPTATHNPGTLVNKNGTVYLIGNNGLLGLPDWSTLQSWGYTSADIVPANSADNNLSLVGNLPSRQPQYLAPLANTQSSVAPSNSSSSAPDFTMPFSNDASGTSRAYNQSLSFSFSATDAQGGNLTAKVGWGDSTSDTLSVNAQTNVPAVFSQFNHTYKQPGSYLVTITVTDSSGLSTTKTANLIMVDPSIANPPTGGPKILFSANGSAADNGSKNITVNPGDWVSFRYNVTNADAVDSTYSTDSADTCSGDFSSGKLIDTWIIKSSNGLALWYVDNCRAGHTYIFTVRGSKPDGNPTIAVETVVVKVNPIASSYTLSQPVITGQTSVLAGTSNLYSAIAYGKSFTSNLGYYINYTFDWGDGSAKESKAIESGYSVYHVWQNSGIYTITVTATDSLGKSTSNTLSVKVSSPASPITISTDVLPSAFTGDSYSYQLQASGGTAPYKWGLGSGGNLPCCWLGISQSGLVTAYQGVVGQYDSVGGKLLGNSLIGDWQVAITVTDAFNQTVTKNLSWKVKPHMAIITGSLPTGKVGISYNAQVQYRYLATDKSLNTVTFDGLPTGLWIDALDGNQAQVGPSGVKALFSQPDANGITTFAITGTPTQSGTFSVKFVIEDSINSASGTIILPLQVNP